MVRVVKGAYWDTEIKLAQQFGLDDYPVFTQKHHTDLSFEACAARLLSGTRHIFPQLATHNAHTIAHVLSMDPSCDHFEMQRLHGMGALLYKVTREQHPNLKVRTYAPVGRHKDLLPYLVRRLLENGANSSFVNRFLDKDLPVTSLLKDPITEVVGVKVNATARSRARRDLRPKPQRGDRPGVGHGISRAFIDAVAGSRRASTSNLCPPAYRRTSGQRESRPLVSGHQCGDRRVVEATESDADEAMKSPTGSARLEQPWSRCARRTA